jgi:hypothetical protein
MTRDAGLSSTGSTSADWSFVPVTAAPIPSPRGCSTRARNLSTCARTGRRPAPFALELLSAAKLLGNGYDRVQDLDDPELIASLAALGANLRIILPSGLAASAGDIGKARSARESADD